MEVYRCTIRLKDYLFYATTERGKVYETGAFIHNYSLAYALHVVSGPYSNRIQKPLYQEHLDVINKQGLYITPARLSSSPNYCLHQFNTLKEGYGFGKKDRSIGYPDWGYLRMIAPETEFVFYVLFQDRKAVKAAGNTLFLSQLDYGKLYLRLGKFLSKAYVEIIPASNIKIEEKGEFVANVLLNWRDLHLEPLFFDLVGTSLPTKLIANGHFQEGKCLTVSFEEEEQKVVFPVEMSFLYKL